MNAQSPFVPRKNLAELHERTAPYAAHVAGTEPPPFDWPKWNREMDARMAATLAALERWKATAAEFGSEKP
jgi:hypothetical protein